jgi:hypothetical protein
MNSIFPFLIYLFLFILSSGLFETKLIIFEQNSSTIGTHCESHYDCSENQFCFNNSCQCEPNYKYDLISNTCEPFKCRLDEDCNEFDSLRECRDNGFCKCKKYDSDDANIKFYNLTFGSDYSSNYECRESGDNYQVCIFGECLCQPNYNLTGEDLFCTYCNCSNSDECRRFDENRICLNGSCVCNSITEESMDDYLCEYSDFIVDDYTFVII